MPEHRALISMGVAVLARLSTADLRVRFLRFERKIKILLVP